jgi:hypothetical protein
MSVLTRLDLLEWSKRLTSSLVNQKSIGCLLFQPMMVIGNLEGEIEMDDEKFVDECLDDYMLCLRKILREKLIEKMPDSEDDEFIDILDVQLKFSDDDYCLVMHVTVDDMEWLFGGKFGLDCDGFEIFKGVMK